MSDLSKAALERFKEWGAEGGKKSSARMTKKQLRERALKGVAARKRNGTKRGKKRG